MILSCGRNPSFRLATKVLSYSGIDLGHEEREQGLEHNILLP